MMAITTNSSINVNADSLKRIVLCITVFRSDVRSLERTFFLMFVHNVCSLEFDLLDRGEVPVRRGAPDSQHTAARSGNELVKEPRRLQFAGLFPSRPRVAQSI